MAFNPEASDFAATALFNWGMGMAWVSSGFVRLMVSVMFLMYLCKLPLRNHPCFETPPVFLAYISVRAKTWSVLLCEAATHHRPC